MANTESYYENHLRYKFCRSDMVQIFCRPEVDHRKATKVARKAYKLSALSGGRLSDRLKAIHSAIESIK